MLTLITCMGGVDVDTGHMHGGSGCLHWSHAWEGWRLTLVTCMGGVDVDTDHMHGRSGC